MLHFSIYKGANQKKQTTLEDLYYGNINPCEITFVKGYEYACFFAKKCIIKLYSLWRFENVLQ